MRVEEGGGCHAGEEEGEEEEGRRRLRQRVAVALAPLLKALTR
jgi:hypothetical protein